MGLGSGKQLLTVLLPLSLCVATILILTILIPLLCYMCVSMPLSVRPVVMEGWVWDL